jgi:cytochrome P450
MTGVDQAVLSDGRTVWVVHEFELARQVLADPRLSKDSVEMDAKSHLAALPPAAREILKKHVFNLESTQHVKLRRLIAQGLTGPSVRAMRPEIEAIAHRLLDSLDPDVEVDLVSEYANLLPAHVVGTLMGIPETERLDIREWSEAFMTEMWLTTDRAVRATESLHNYVQELVRRKRSAPGSDLVSRMIKTNASDEDLHSTLCSMLIASPTVPARLIASSLYLLLTHPDQLDAVCADPSLLAGAVEESLRVKCPVLISQHRMTTEPVQIGDALVPAGEIVVCSLPDAHHDNVSYVDPDTYDVRRADNKHLAFGFGRHVCMGSSLARLQTEIAISVFLGKYPRTKIAVPVEELSWVDGLILRELTALPVRLNAC